MLGPLQQRALVRGDRRPDLIQSLQALRFAKYRFPTVYHAHLNANLTKQPHHPRFALEDFAKVRN